MENRIPTKTVATVEKAGVMLAGAGQYGATIPLTVVTQASLLAAVTGVTDGVVAENQAKTELITRQAAVRLQMKAIREFLMKARDTFKIKWGTRHNQSWIVGGFATSTEIPRTDAEVVQLLQSVKGFLVANSTFEVEGLGITGANATTLLTQVEAARGAVNAQEKHLRDLFLDRGAKVIVLRRSMASMIAEMKSRLTPLDSRWLAFGLNMPGAVAAPPAPTNVVAVLIGSTSAAVRWNASARAEYYRVYIRTAVEQPWTWVGSPADLDFTIDELLRNTKTEVAVSAVNSGGESALSAITAVTTLP